MRTYKACLFCFPYSSSLALKHLFALSGGEFDKSKDDEVK